MKYVFMILALFLIGCDESNHRNNGVVGEYWGGSGTIDGKEIIFLYVFEYPADQSIGVSYATESETFLCRYFKTLDTTYVSIPSLEDDAITNVNIYGSRFNAESEGETENPCTKVNIINPFVWMN